MSVQEYMNYSSMEEHYLFIFKVMHDAIVSVIPRREIASGRSLIFQNVSH